jgi:FAD binding domain
MNTGMQDACNLAWKLALVIRGIAREEPLLGSYSLERSAVGDAVLKGAGRLTEIGTTKGGVKQSIRNHIFSLMFGLAPFREMAANAASEVSIGYPDSPLSCHGKHGAGKPYAGERAPIQKDDQPVGAGDTPRFALFSEESDEQGKQLLEGYGNLLEPKIRKPFTQTGLWLVRPDGYTALTTKRDCWDEVTTYLDQITG